MEKKTLAVFVSGGGSNIRVIHEDTLGGKVNADGVALVTDKPGCGGADHARGNGIPVVVFPNSKSAPEGAYLRSILNIHPSLLPAFGGKGYYSLKVHKAVIVSGARYSSPTVHFVDEQYDTERTLFQRVVPVVANDTPELLATRVLHEEHKVMSTRLLPYVRTELCGGNQKPDIPNEYT